MTVSSHQESCGNCHRTPCACTSAAVIFCANPEEAMWEESATSYDLLLRNDRLHSENARLRQEALMAELEIRNLRAALHARKCAKCGSAAMVFELVADAPKESK